MNRLNISGVLLLAAMVCGLGCDGNKSASSSGDDDGKLRVVATTSMIGDLVQQIGGDRISLKVIMGPGVDPHTFKPSPGDFAELAGAKMVFYNGLHLEGKMVETLEGKLKDKSVAVAGAIPAANLLSWQEGEGGAHDPHVWFDVSLWSMAAGAIRDGLAKADPANASEYQERHAKLTASLGTLHREVTEKIASIPKERRVLITSHDAYNYFAKAYDIEVRGLQGISTETEAGIQAINGAVDFIIARKIPAIFVESSVSPKSIERVRDDCKAKGFDVKIPGELFSDAMGQPGQHPPYAVETYEGMVRYNVDTIVNELK